MNDYERNADVSKTLTDKWEKDEIYKGTYYCKSKLDGHQCIASFVSDKGLFDCAYNGTLNKGYWEVLSEVPSYESWKKHRKVTAETQIKNCDLEITNTKLKELLKECRSPINYALCLNLSKEEKIELKSLLVKINQVLGE